MDPSIGRILDANFNRAREGLRVMEDYLRFVLDDSAGVALVKQLRHDLVAAYSKLDQAELLAARNTPGDVGTTLATSSEASRSDGLAVFTAASKRFPEAVRTLEEYAKIDHPQVAHQMEALRYRGYEIEQRVLCRGHLAERFAQVRLYVLLTQALCRHDWQKTAEAVIAGGADCIQLREKELDDREFLARARWLVALARSRGVLIIVNDRPDIAALADADGVHLGQEDLSISDARRIVGSRRLLGLSTHNPAQLEAAREERPDYLAVGPMFASSTKPQNHVPGPNLLTHALETVTIPVVAIGGITLERAERLNRKARCCLCICSAIIGQDNPESATRQFKNMGPQEPS